MNVEHQFLNICKICKKVYKDKGGLADHQRQQHNTPQGQVAMNRFNNTKEFARKSAGFQRNFTGKDERLNNGEAGNVTKNLRVDLESYATLQKPPASLKPKLQSRAHQQLASFSRTKNSPSSSFPNGGQAAKGPFDFEDNDPEPEEWKKWEPEKDVDATIITASVAQSTAACYSPTGQSIMKPFADIGKEMPPSSRPQSLGTLTSDHPRKAPPPINRNEAYKGPPSLNPIQRSDNYNLPTPMPKGGPSVNYKPSSSITTNGNGSVGSQNSRQAAQPSALSGNKGGVRIPIPKLMSKTKAQFQILKSQATRPKILPRNSANNALPRVAGDIQSPPLTPSKISPPKLIKQADLPQSANPEQFLNPPQLLREFGGSSKAPQKVQPKAAPTRGGGGRGRLSPPKTNLTKNPSVSPPTRGMGAVRGPGRPRGRGRGAPNFRNSTTVVRRESLHTPSGTGSSSNSSEEDSGDSDSSSPPPMKKPNRSEEPMIEEEDDGERIFGKDYKCPPVGKVASYLNKKGTRVWICLVCEQPEEEISGGPMICCDTCEDWYHFMCVGIEDEPPDDEKWYCKRCIYKSLQSKLQQAKKPVGRGRGAARSRGARGKRKM